VIFQGRMKRLVHEQCQGRLHTPLIAHG
jgi:hypothetical protein